MKPGSACVVLVLHLDLTFEHVIALALGELLARRRGALALGGDNVWGAGDERECGGESEGTSDWNRHPLRKGKADAGVVRPKALENEQAGRTVSRREVSAPTILYASDYFFGTMT